MISDKIKNKIDLFAHIITRDAETTSSGYLIEQIYEWAIRQGFHPSTDKFTKVMWVDFMLERYAKNN